MLHCGLIESTVRYMLQICCMLIHLLACGTKLQSGATVEFRVQVQLLPTEGCKNCLRTVKSGKREKVGCHPTPSQLTSCYRVTDSTWSLVGDHLSRSAPPFWRRPLPAAQAQMQKPLRLLESCRMPKDQYFNLKAAVILWKDWII